MAASWRAPDHAPSLLENFPSAALASCGWRWPLCSLCLINGEFMLGRAPAHALFVGFFGSLLVAMVTRVTQGHAGRPLQLGRVAGFAFVAIQLVCVARIVAEFAPDSMAWQAAAAIGWLLAFATWIMRSLRIFLAPRADGKPG